MDLKRASAGRKLPLQENCLRVWWMLMCWNGCQNVSVYIKEIWDYYFICCIKARILWKLFCVLQ